MKALSSNLAFNRQRLSALLCFLMVALAACTAGVPRPTASPRPPERPSETPLPPSLTPSPLPTGTSVLPIGAVSVARPTLTPLSTITPYPWPLLNVAISGDGRYVASASRDGILSLWGVP